MAASDHIKCEGSHLTVDPSAVTKWFTMKPFVHQQGNAVCPVCNKEMFVNSAGMRLWDHYSIKPEVLNAYLAKH